MLKLPVRQTKEKKKKKLPLPQSPLFLGNVSTVTEKEKEEEVHEILLLQTIVNVSAEANGKANRSKLEGKIWKIIYDH